ncbi:hypothetical protein G4B88_022208 [Cannabis sativa]|uniref:Uncharacterized protein n=1 Tax=Cannabis sativa TaxID=3483 RepID=A0A7J6FXT7_CANSA|nr:hypothetical protein G4B88_022208 [Cannabis sativa]
MAVSREEANVSLKKLKGMLFEDVKYFKKLNGCFLEMLSRSIKSWAPTVRKNSSQSHQSIFHVEFAVNTVIAPIMLIEDLASNMFIQPAFHFTSRNLQRVGGGYKSSCNVEPSLTKESSDEIEAGLLALPTLFDENMQCLNLCDLKSGEDYLLRVESCIEASTRRHKEHIQVELNKTDAKLMRNVNIMEQLKLKLGSIAVHDYHSILLPLVNFISLN